MSSAGSRDDERHVTTDRGLAPPSEPEPKKGTDPGVAPPSGAAAALEVVDPTAPTPPPVSEVVPAVKVLDASPELPPLAIRLGGDPTPVPAEMTDGLLSGLIASENEAYFRRAKAASASAGDAAAAFHGEPRPVSPGNPTPPPEPPVLLRRSVEMDIVEAAHSASSRRERSEVTTEPNPVDLRFAPREALPDPTMPLPEPRPPWAEKAVAFGAAVLAVGVIGVLLVRWLSGGPTPATPQTAQSEVQTASPPVPPSVPVEPRAASIPSAQTPDPTPTAEAQPARTSGASGRPVSPGQGPRTTPTTPRAPHSSGAPPEVVPPPKDDVKRSM
jgi:hypothetical protein